MIATEKNMYQNLKKHFHGQLILRIESGGTSLGIPDIFFRMKECEGWAELKILQRFPIYATVKIPFQPGQYNWLQKYAELGGNAILLVYVIESRLYYIFKNENIKTEYDNKKDFLGHTNFSGQMRVMRKEDLCCSL